MAKVKIDNNEYGSGKIDSTEKDNKEKYATSLFDNTSSDGKEFLKHLRSNGIFDRTDMKYRTSFYPFKRMDPHNRVQGTREYVFFTKPHIPIVNSSGNLTDQFEKITFFKVLKDRGYTEILQDLSGTGKDKCQFVRILSNRLVSSIDTPGISVNSIETAQNMWGTKIIYPTTSMSSDESIEFTCEFEETKYLEIYTFFKAWDVYRQMKWWGVIEPESYVIDHKILNDHISVYKFIVDEDGETIMYWCKWTGLFPSSISRNSFSEIAPAGPLSVTVTFKLSGWFEDMEPNILSDFNQLVNLHFDGSGHEIWDCWLNDYGTVNQENMLTPYIKRGTSNTNTINPYIPFYFEWVEK